MDCDVFLHFLNNFLGNEIFPGKLRCFERDKENTLSSFEMEKGTLSIRIRDLLMDLISDSR